MEQVGHPDKGRIWLEVDGTPRQDSDLSLMIWRTPEIIATLSRYFSLEPGDIISTGTSAGVGNTTGDFLKPGDNIVASIESIGALHSSVIAEG